MRKQGTAPMHTEHDSSAGLPTESSSPGQKLSPSQVGGPHRVRRGYVRISILLATLLGGGTFLPTVLLQTPLRDQVVSSALGNSELTATASSAEGGWIAPVVFRDVTIRDQQGQFLCTISELRSARGLLGALTAGPSKGLITLVGPRLEIRTDQDGRWPKFGDSGSRRPQLQFQILDGALSVRVPWRELPIVDVDNLNLSGALEPDATGASVLTVEPSVILDHEPLSDAHSQQNLALVAPVLAQSTKLQGSASIRLDAIRIPLPENGPIAPFPISGEAEFHELNASLRDDWIRQLMFLSGTGSAASLPGRVEVLKDSKVRFTVTEEGIRHDGMTFLLPQLAHGLSLQSSGLIRLDEQLELSLTMTFPEVIPANRPFLAVLGQLSGEPLTVDIRGTVTEPSLQFPEGSSVWSELTKRITPAGFESPDGGVPGAISGLLQGLSQPDKSDATGSLPGSILGLIKSIDEVRKSKAAGEDPQPKPGRRKRRN